MRRHTVCVLAVIVLSAVAQAARGAADIDALLAACKSGEEKSCRDLADAINAALPTASATDVAGWAVAFDGVSPSEADIPIRLALAAKLPDKSVGTFSAIELGFWLKKNGRLGGTTIVKVERINGYVLPKDIKSPVRILPGEYRFTMLVGASPIGGATQWGRAKDVPLSVGAACSYKSSSTGGGNDASVTFSQTCPSPTP